MRELAKCFYDVFDKSKPHTIMDAGLRVVEVRRITGTLDKCGELDRDFRYIKRHDRAERSRWYRLHEAAKSYRFFPPIDTVLYGGEYFVVDGNRRVASAKALKVEFIDAHVKEYVAREDSDSTSGSFSRRRFEIETGLKSVNLLHELGYPILLEEIAPFAGWKPEGTGEGEGTGKDIRALHAGAGRASARSADALPAGARKWYSEVFIPACAQISSSELPQRYPDLSPGDIFVLIARFYREFMGGLPRDVNFRTVISGFMFARRIPQRRVWRLFPFRALQSIFMGRRSREGFFPNAE